MTLRHSDYVRMEELSISPEEQLKKQARALGIPTSLTLELTTSCQLSCSHCYNFDRSINTQTTSLDYTTVRNILNQAAELGVFTVELTGGESTLHPDLERVIECAKDKHFKVIVKTHGAISLSRVHRMVEAGVDEVHLSLYGLEKVHDAFTGVRGSWRKTYGTVQRFLELGIRTTISLIMHSKTVHDIFALRDQFLTLGANVTVGGLTRTASG